MKSPTSLIINIIYSILLSISLPMCLMTAFNIKCNLITLVLASVLLSIISCCSSYFFKRKITYLVSEIIQILIFSAVVYLKIDLIAGQFEYALNKILAIYSSYLSVPSSVELVSSSYTANNAIVITLILAFVISQLCALSLIKLRKNFIIYLTGLILLIPCFIMVNTPPNICPIAIALSIMFSLYISAYARKKTKSAGAILSSITAIVLSVVISIINIIFPANDFERFQWQWDLLNYFEVSAGKDISNNRVKNLLNTSRSNVADTEDLATLGDFKLTGTKIMQVKSDDDGVLYLKGMSYANFDNNKWTILNNEQAGTYPAEYDAFTMTYSDSAIIHNVQVKTARSESVMFTPYYLYENAGTAVADAFIKNNGDTAYELSYFDNTNTDDLFRPYSTRLYDNFVSKNYCQLPESTKSAMLDIITSYSSDYLLSYNSSPSEIADFVKKCVSNTAEYSVTPERMPSGEDFPIWFLQNAKTGYCVHFASSAVAMLRALNVPARYVTGYAVSTKKDTWTTVTSDNAHAWAEYYDSDIGWVLLEATPASFTTNTNSEIRENQQSSSSTTQPATNSTINNPAPTNIKSEFKITAPIVIIGIAIALILLAILRVKFINRLRNKRFSSGRNKKRVIYIYRYIVRISKNKCIPDNIRDIAEEAKFSNHIITDSNVKVIYEYAEKQRQALYSDAGFIKKLFYRIILVL